MILMEEMVSAKALGWEEHVCYARSSYRTVVAAVRRWGESEKDLRKRREERRGERRQKNGQRGSRGEVQATEPVKEHTEKPKQY